MMMRSQQHTLWLEPYLRQKKVALQKTSRLDNIISQTHGEPSLLLFIGKSSKSKALRYLATPSRSKRNGRDGGEIHLLLDKGTQSIQSRPLLFADGPIPNIEKNTKDTEECLDVEPISQNLQWAGGDLNFALSNIYINLLSPFTDVVCLFLSDFGNLSDVTDFIAQWLHNFNSRTLSPICYPRLLIVVDNSTIANPDNSWESCWKKKFFRLLKKKTIRQLKEAFSYVGMHHLFTNDQTHEFQYSKLKDRLLNESDAIRSIKIEQRIHFVGKHFNALFDYAHDHFVQDMGTCFNFIKASRLSNPVSSNLKQHILKFLKHFQNVEEINRFALPVIASCILLDSFPPEMHGFDPIEIFQTLYQTAWRKVTEEHSIVMKKEIFSIEEVINKLYVTEFANRQDFKQSHTHTISSFKDTWKSIHSDATCLMCLCRRPEYSLPCGHSFCGIDIQRFGTALNPNSHRFTVSSCFLCSQDTSGAQFRFKPKTKGISVLGIDGGGVRGVIPLQVLLLLEQKLKPYLPQFPIQDLFDIRFGTSSGGIIAMSLSFKNLSVTQCLKDFEIFSREAFDRGFVPSNFIFSRLRELFIPRFADSIFSRLRELLISYFADSLYSAHNLEESLRAHFGDEMSLMDYTSATSKGIKVGVTVTGVPHAELVLTNYNGVGSRSSKSGYRHVLPDQISNRIRAWEAARSTSAAPWYFTPYYVDGAGELNDGGLWRNNPTDIAIAEARALYPTIAEPDVVLSLGTGHQIDEYANVSSSFPTEASPLLSSPVVSTATTLHGVQPRGLWRSGFVTRCLESFLGTMDGQKFYDLPNQWNRTTGGIEERYFRFNTQLRGKAPDLDDVSTMSSLKSETRKQHLENQSLDELAESLISTLFYFELNSRPIKDRSSISCQGYILCIIDPDDEGDNKLYTLLDSLTNEESKFYVAHCPLLGPINSPINIDPITKQFRVKVELKVRDLNSPIPISLQIGQSRQSIREGRSISASPFTINGLLEAQGWKNPFGCVDHGPTDPDDLNRFSHKSTRASKRYSEVQGRDGSKRQRR